MAKRDATLQVTRARKRSPAKETRSSRDPRLGISREGHDRQLIDAVEAERSRLLKAEAVLNSVTVALGSSSADMNDGTTYAMAVEVACDFVHESLNRLELLQWQLKPGRVVPTTEVAPKS